MKRTRTVAETLSIDEIAGMTDAEAVRRQFDARNIRWLAIFTSIFFLASVIMLFLAAFHKGIGRSLLPQAAAHLLFAFMAAAFFGELAMTERSRGTRAPRLPVHILQRNLMPWVIGYLAIEFLFLTTFHTNTSEGWLAWTFIFPWLVIPVRLFLTRRFWLHVALIAIVLFNVKFLPTRAKTILPEVVTSSVMNVVAFGLGALSTRRVRVDTVEEWTERRTSAREQLRMRDELRYAREVQLSMLPESAPKLDWVDLAAISLPATEVGGDYFDYFPEETSVALVCGDVAGHGLASGIVLASLRSGFTLLRHSLIEPSAVLRQLNDLVAQTSRRRMLATAAVVLLDRTKGEATIASAGHPPVMLGRNGTVTPIELFAPPLGVRLPFHITSRTMPFQPGDVFVLHSDGVYESQNEKGEVYGLDRLQKLLMGIKGDAASIRDAILRDVETFRGSMAQADDVTVVVAAIR